MNEAENRDAERTSSQVLFAALEEFGKSEAKCVLVVFLDENNDVVQMRNSNHSQTIGFCEYVKESCLRRIFENMENG